MYIDNKRKDILILCKGPTQGLDGTIFKAEAKFLLTLHNPEKDLYWVCTVMETTVSYLLMLQNYINSKEKTQK